MKNTKATRMEGQDFNIYVDMSGISSSILLDSDTQIASLKSDNLELSLEVRGEVRLSVYDGNQNIIETYRRASDMPEELKAAINADPNWYDSGKYYVGDNNWFELFYLDNEGNYMDSAVVDVEYFTPEKLEEFMREAAAQYRSEFLAKAPEEKDEKLQKVVDGYMCCDTDVAAEVLAEYLMDDSISTYKMFEELAAKYIGKNTTQEERNGIDFAVGVITGWNLPELADEIVKRTNT